MNKLMMIPIFAAIVMMFSSVTVGDAYGLANTGNIEDGGSGVHPAKITFEKAGEYFWDDTVSSSGAYYKIITPDGSSGWTNSAMADGYDRHVRTNQLEDADIDFDISPRSENTVNFKMAYDTTTSVTLTEARNELVSAEPWFEDEHGIVFNEWNSNSAWTSSGQSTTNCFSVQSHAESDANWSSGNYGSADILAAFSDGHMGSTSSKACGDVPGTGGQHPSMYVDIRTSDTDYNRDRRVAHELTHNYGMSHLTSCTNAWPGLMAVTATAYCDYIINWTPTNDSNLENRRGWY